METLGALIATGDPCALAVALVALVVGAVLSAAAVRLRPRPRRRAAR